MERTRVIIADDESIIRMDLREMLTNLGYLVIGEVGDGRSAVNLARELRPDVVIMDIKMPDMDGIDAAKALTEERVSPVLLLTAYSQQELIERATLAFANIQNEMSSLARQVAREKGYEVTDYRDVIRELKKERIAGDQVVDFYKKTLASLEEIIVREKLVSLPERKADIQVASEARSAAMPELQR